MRKSAFVASPSVSSVVVLSATRNVPQRTSGKKSGLLIASAKCSSYTRRSSGERKTMRSRSSRTM
jgi:hypothetical protein